MAELFGFSFKKKEGKSRAPSPIQPSSDDGATSYIAGGYYGQYLDLDGNFKTEYDMVKKYREMAMHPEVDEAIEDIIHEAIVADQNDSPVQVNLDNLEVSDSVKTMIRDEFDYIKNLFGFDSKAHEMFRRWYIDGRMYYHKVIDLDNPAEGIKELRYVDPHKIKKVRQITKPKTADEFMKYDFGKGEEYFLYNPKGLNNTSANSGIRIAKDAITYCTSGLMDTNRNIVLSYLHKGIKVLNQLRMIEDSLVIYRISRAPERRIFYIDVGNLPKQKAETYLREVMGRYRNKLVYDANTGEIRDDRKYMSMMEDFWLPRREGGRGTEITTLPGGQNLGELTDVQYFQTKLYKALNVPAGRLDSQQQFNIGRSAEITRDELKFTKFVGKLRKKFSDIFNDTLKTQLILKSVITPEDWDEMKEHIQYDYLYDNHFTELKNLEMMTEKLNVIAAMDPYVGKYFSTDYIRSEILGQTETQMEELDIQMKDDIDSGRVIDPLSQTELDQGMIDADIENIPKDQEMKDVQIAQQKAAARNGEAPPKMNGKEDPRKSAARTSASQNGNGNK
ncbi:portal vertex protein of head [Prochlorococcus phage P-HM2]|uniref:Portal protein n=1 Tax=Prochlorococcus phage P-HM2 TaxID=445696 RepID=E3SSW8_9CAUD|nr:portal protein [Prochlorococcus phage P-HM2]ADO99896.1 portal vertex protein of head [Prochlorococcus phage P-HM2]